MKKSRYTGIFYVFKNLKKRLTVDFLNVNTELFQANLFLIRIYKSIYHYLRTFLKSGTSFFIARF